MLPVASLQASKPMQLSCFTVTSSTSNTQALSPIQLSGQTWFVPGQSQASLPFSPTQHSPSHAAITSAAVPSKQSERVGVELGTGEAEGPGETDGTELGTGGGAGLGLGGWVSTRAIKLGAWEVEGA